MIYLIFMCGSAVLAFLSQCSTSFDLRVCGRDVNPVKSLLGVMAFLVLFVPSAIRYGIGTDYFYTYVPLFVALNTSQTSISGKLIEFNEGGFNSLNRIIGHFTMDYQWLFGIVALVTVGLTFAVIYKHSKSVVLSIVLYVLSGAYLFSYTGLRQALGLAIFMFSLRYLFGEKKVKFALMGLLAASMHSISLIYLPTYFFQYFRLKNRTMVTLVIVALILYTPIGFAIQWLIARTSYAWYLNSTFNNSENNLLLTLMNTGILLLMMYLAGEHHDEKMNFYLNLQMAAVLIGIYSSFIPGASRVAYSFYFLSCLGIPEFLNYGRDRKLVHFFGWATMGAFLVYYTYVIIIIGAYRVLPYRSIFSM